MKTNKWIIWLLTAFLIIGFIVGCQFGEMRSEGSKTRDTAIVERVDTVYNDTVIEKTKLIPKVVEKLKVDTITKDTVLTTERKTYITECTNNNDTAIITTTIQGVNASLDSLSVLWRKHTIEKEKIITITNYVDKPKKFITITPQIGVGYGVFQKKIDMYVGVGASLNF